MSQNVSFFSRNLFYTYIKNYLGAKRMGLLFFSAQIDYRLDPKWIDNTIPDVWRFYPSFSWPPSHQGILIAMLDRCYGFCPACPAQFAVSSGS
jgi:hypothetical protein